MNSVICEKTPKIMSFPRIECKKCYRIFASNKKYDNLNGKCVIKITKTKLCNQVFRSDFLWNTWTTLIKIAIHGIFHVQKLLIRWINIEHLCKQLHFFVWIILFFSIVCRFFRSCNVLVSDFLRSNSFNDVRMFSESMNCIHSIGTLFSMCTDIIFCWWIFYYRIFISENIITSETLVQVKLNFFINVKRSECTTTILLNRLTLSVWMEY